MLVLPFDPNRLLKNTESALFRDFDGTLIDLAPTPQSVQIPPELVPLIERLRMAFDGRVCIVSGRTVADLKHFLDDTPVDVIAEHGAVTRMLDVAPAQLPDWPASWHEHLLTVDTCIPNLVVELKTTAVALHYRLQPDLEPEVIQFAALLRGHAPSEYIVVNSNMTTEIRRINVDKDTAIKAAMRTPRYIGRTPIFIADDVTDIVGFDAVRGLGGLALHVGTDFAGEPVRVRRWLKALVETQEACA